MSTKREDYLEAKQFVADLEAQEIKLRNLIYTEEQKAENLSNNLRVVWEAQRDVDRRACSIRLRKEKQELYDLQDKLSSAKSRFYNLQYDCDHKQKDGTLAVGFGGGFGELGDKPKLECSICGETWE